MKLISIIIIILSYQHFLQNIHYKQPMHMPSSGHASQVSSSNQVSAMYGLCDISRFNLQFKNSNGESAEKCSYSAKRHEPKNAARRNVLGQHPPASLESCSALLGRWTGKPLLGKADALIAFPAGKQAGQACRALKVDIVFNQAQLLHQFQYEAFYTPFFSHRTDRVTLQADPQVNPAKCDPN